MTWRPIDGTHLGWTSCATCPAEVLSVPAYAGRARCGHCAAPPPVAPYPPGPVIGHPIGLGPRREVAAVRPAPAPLPRVPLRETYSLDEIASGRGQAMFVGRLARERGWRVEPRYAVAADGTELSVLLLRAGPLRAVALWRREPGAGWTTDVAYGWRIPPEVPPRKLGVKRLADLIKQMGEQDDGETSG